MTKNIITLCLLATTMLFGACTKEDPKATSADVTIHFNNTANGQVVVMDDVLRYTSASGQKFSTSMLKYYVGSLRLVKADGTEVKLAGYHLIDEASAGKKVKLTVPSVPNGEYTKLIFSLGVDKTTNASAQFGGDLDLSKGMYWEMTGYSFLKHEGRYEKPNGTSDVLLYHYGRNEALVGNIQIPLTGAVVDGKSREVNVQFALDKVYSGTYDFNIYNFQMSSNDSELPWIQLYKGGLAGAFSFQSME